MSICGRVSRRICNPEPLADDADAIGFADLRFRTQNYAGLQIQRDKTKESV